MSKQASRVGLAESQVDVYGRIKLSRKQLARIIQSLPRWTDFKSFKNGTEQLLPVNMDEPSTTPLWADIEYPDELRNNQFFLYRKSPTTKDGTAWLRSIRGNTVKFNQLVQNGNFADTSSWETVGVNLTVSGNIGTVVPTNDGGTIGLRQQINGINGHQYFVSFGIKANKNAVSSFRFYNSDTSTFSAKVETSITENSQSMVKGLLSLTADYDYLYFYPVASGQALLTDIYEYSNAMCFDLTTIFGAGNEPTTVAQFEAWLSTYLGLLDYYAHNPGSLISFNGTDLKTVGFNQWNEEWEVGEISTTNGENVSGSNIIRSKNYIPVFPNAVYYFKTGNSAVNTYRHFYDADKNYLGYVLANTNSVLTTPANAYYMRFRLGTAYGSTYNNNICINISDTSKNGTYEPYTSSTLSLPISTYFPTGMKSAGSVYDELTGIKATTRIGAVDLESFNWTYKDESGSELARFELNLSFENIGQKNPSRYSEMANILCAKYITSSWNNMAVNDKRIAISPDGWIAITDSSFSDVTTFKNAMSGVYLFYELAEPVEVPVIELN